MTIVTVVKVERDNPSEPRTVKLLTPLSSFAGSYIS